MKKAFCPPEADERLFFSRQGDWNIEPWIDEGFGGSGWITCKLIYYIFLMHLELHTLRFAYCENDIFNCKNRTSGILQIYIETIKKNKKGSRLKNHRSHPQNRSFEYLLCAGNCKLPLWKYFSLNQFLLRRNIKYPLLWKQSFGDSTMKKSENEGQSEWESESVSLAAQKKTEYEFIALTLHSHSAFSSRKWWNIELWIVVRY